MGDGFETTKEGQFFRKVCLGKKREGGGMLGELTGEPIHQSGKTQIHKIGNGNQGGKGGTSNSS